MALQIPSGDIHLRSSSTMGLQTNMDLTLCFWIKATWTGTDSTFVGLYGPATDVALGTPIAGIKIGSRVSTNELVMRLLNDTVVVGSGSGTTSGLSGTWVHVTYTYDQYYGYHRLYLNGVESSSVGITQPTGYLNQLYINGYPNGGTAQTSSFQIDQLTLYWHRFYYDDISTMYEAQGSRHGILEGAIARYEFYGGAAGASVSSIPDLQNKGNTLTPIGTGSACTYVYAGAVANSNIRPVQ
jgi:hypothetical protein